MEVEMKSINSAALTMLKKYLRRQLEAHYQTTDIASIGDFRVAINSNTFSIAHWFRCGFDYSLNNKIEDMLNILGHKDVWSLLEPYELCVLSHEDVRCLKLADTNLYYPYAVPASVIFDALRPLSMSSLKMLSPSIYSQIIDDK